MKFNKFIYIFLVIILIIAISLVSYKIIMNNRSNNIVFLLLGSKEEKIFLHEKYNDMGCFAKLKDGTIINEYISTTGYVDVGKIGKYEIIYTLNYQGITKELVRSVNVLKDPATDINLTLNGDKVIYLLKGSEYQEQGVSATDIIDGDLQSSLKISNYIDYNYTGEYIINYEVINSRNTKKSIERKIIIYDYNYELDVKYNNEGMLKLNFITDSDNVSNLVINGEIVNGKNIDLILESNNEYNIDIIDIYGNKKSSFYDFKNPELTCVATITMSGVSIESSASDNHGILKYTYYVGDKEYVSESNAYSNSSISTSIKVSAFDKNNNQTTKNCEIVDNVPYYDSGLKNSKYNDWLYYLYVPENVKQYEKSPLIIFLHGTGERGSNLSLIERYGFVKFIKEGQKYNSFILVPQLKSGRWRDDFSRVISLIESIKLQYNVDEKRIGIVGFSLGAIDAMVGIQTYTDYFSSAVLIAPSDRGKEYASAFKNIPTQVINGELDYASHSTGITAFIDELKRIGGSVSYTRIPNKNHVCVNEALQDGQVVNWMLNQRRN